MKKRQSIIKRLQTIEEKLAAVKLLIAEVDTSPGMALWGKLDNAHCAVAETIEAVKTEQVPEEDEPDHKDQIEEE